MVKEESYTICQIRLFISNNAFTDNMVDSTIMPGYRTDHSPIEISFVLNRFQKGRGVWKFNCDLLQKPKYLEMVNNIISDT